MTCLSCLQLAQMCLYAKKFDFRVRLFNKFGVLSLTRNKALKLFYLLIKHPRKLLKCASLLSPDKYRQIQLYLTLLHRLIAHLPAHLLNARQN